MTIKATMKPSFGIATSQPSKCKGLRTLAVEIFKTLNEVNPPYMKNIFTPKEKCKLRQNDTSRFGTQSLRSLGRKIWNLPSNIKSETSFSKLKEYIKAWLGPKCRCKICINM